MKHNWYQKQFNVANFGMGEKKLVNITDEASLLGTCHFKEVSSYSRKKDCPTWRSSDATINQMLLQH
jgi:hypothetical protein